MAGDESRSSKHSAPVASIATRIRRLNEKRQDLIRRHELFMRRSIAGFEDLGRVCSERGLRLAPYLPQPPPVFVPVTAANLAAQEDQFVVFDYGYYQWKTMQLFTEQWTEALVANDPVTKRALLEWVDNAGFRVLHQSLPQTLEAYVATHSAHSFQAVPEKNWNAWWTGDAV
ncbi:hypothetical protein BJ508DRAFT_313571 [Ascobolus immersus RN42]|uniref:Uncharacterized protein n=1 Tax=Ascobolus immersus RN42 TaxID=1160509 RepID=A0A3N4HIC2_ASCIM|nr:hypothetical protein BJ508DRAFT_313571 [Ascobolus immersus RN42]